jgi:PAS domain S-box-containing protein
MSTDPVTLTPGHTVREASRIFLEHEIDGAPVVDEHGRMVGLLTKSHLYRVLAGNGDPYTTVDQIMATSVITGQPDETVRDLIKRRVGRLPVVEQDQVVGMVTRSDLAYAYFNSFTDLSNKLQTILDSTHNLIIAIDKNARITLLNRAAENFLNIKSPDVIGKEITQVIPNSGLVETLITGCPRLVQKIMLKDSLFISNRTPIFEDGEIIGAVAVLQDISELENISRELEIVKELNRELDAIIESSHDGLYLTNGEGITLRVNEAFEKMTGVPASEMVGHNVEELVKERGIVSESVSALVLQQKKPVTIIQRTLAGRTALTTGTPVFDRKGRIFRVVSNIRDITELMLLKQQLEQAQGLSKHYESELRALQMKYDTEKLIVGSRIMKDLLENVTRIAQVESTVLITGESGTGKELIAETIHINSPRRNGPFIKINCGAIAKNLLESELFGYDPGAFTGAKKGGRAGYFELADGGTILLDEISELPLGLQASLLRVIQNKEIIRVGGEKTIPVDVRIIAATNRDLGQLVVNQQFREDLYYRLNVVPVEVPPLRARKEEIPLLAAHFIKLFNRKYNMQKELFPDVIDILMNYDWPGNVRELENVIERLVVTVPRDVLTGEDLPKYIKNFRPRDVHPQISVEGVLPLKEAVEFVEREIISHAYSRYRATREVARHLGIDPSTVLRKAAKYGITVEPGKND